MDRIPRVMSVLQTDRRRRAAFTVRGVLVAVLAIMIAGVLFLPIMSFAEEPATEQSDTDGTVAEQADTDSPVSEQTDTDSPATERSDTDSPALEQPDTASQASFADTETTVRVGYYENEVFEEGAAPGAVKTGYAYEYYRKLSEYTGWNYEYVYGSFGELYDMLLAGKIDLLAGLAKREDRIGVIGFPETRMGNEIYTLVRHSEDASVTTDPKTLNGKRIGVLKSAISEVLSGYLLDHNVTSEVILFDDYAVLFEAFDDSGIDVMALEGDSGYGREDIDSVGIFGASDYYLCVNIQRSDLLAELDAAQHQLNTDEPDFINSLRSKYYPASVSSRTFSDAEKEWLDGHGQMVIGYLNNYLPYSDTDSDGNANGIIRDIIPAILNELSLTEVKVVYTGYLRYDDMIADVCSGKIDVAFPVGGGLYYSEENGIYQSGAVASASTDLVYKGEYDEEAVSHFAVNENNRMQYYYIKTCFPEAQITMYPSIEACLEAVLNGEVQATTLNGLRANDMLKNSRYKGLYLKQLTKTDDRSFGVKIGNEGLLKLLNHGINVLGPEYVQKIAYTYSGQLYSYTFTDFLRDHLWVFIVVGILIMIPFAILVVRDMQRTKRESKLKTAFVSNMSHEIRTPITAILGMNELIQMESEDASILQYSDNIEKAGKSLLGIINDILDFSKIEADRMELTIHEYSLRELLDGLGVMIEYRAAKSGLQFSMDIDSRLPVLLKGDDQRLSQVITNLLTNAVKYTEEGSVKLTVKLQSLEGDTMRMEVIVEDTGIGIRENEMEKLYSAFDRLDLERTGTIEGSGLGLTIAQRMLELMGSEIHVESTYGSGSKFSFAISQGVSDPTPIGEFRSSIHEAKNHHQGPSFTAPTARLLIVDDTVMNLQVISGLLKRNRIRIDTAQSGEECISLFGSNDYDMVFLDQRMPQMDGIETLKELMARYPDKVAATPVISLTANVLAGAKEQMIAAGFTDYLPKPVNHTALEEALRRYLPAEKLEEVPQATEEPEDAYEPSEGLSGMLAGIEELDIEKGLSYCGDSEDYLDAIDIYRASVADKAAQLEEYIRTDDREAFSLLVHSVKSTSNAIGATDLAEAAARLEAAANDENNADYKDGVEEFVTRYRRLGEKLETVEIIA